MPSVLIRNLPDKVHKAIKSRAKKNRRSCEAEMYVMLEEAAFPKSAISKKPSPEKKLSFSENLLEIGRKAALTEKEWDAFNNTLQEQRSLWKIRTL